MTGIDELLMFRPLSFAVLTVSDSRTIADDRSGDCLADRLTRAGHNLQVRAIVKDDVAAIAAQTKLWASEAEIDVILTTGGTGLTGRDVTVEAIMPLFDKTLDGFSVLFHQMSAKVIGLATLQSRACAGIFSETFVFCLPGSANAVSQIWDEIIEGGLDSRYRPASLVDLIPRLSE